MPKRAFDERVDERVNEFCMCFVVSSVGAGASYTTNRFKKVKFNSNTLIRVIPSKKDPQYIENNTDSFYNDDDGILKVEPSFRLPSRKEMLRQQFPQEPLTISVIANINMWKYIRGMINRVYYKIFPRSPEENDQESQAFVPFIIAKFNALCMTLSQITYDELIKNDMRKLIDSIISEFTLFILTITSKYTIEDNDDKINQMKNEIKTILKNMSEQCQINVNTFSK